MTNISKKDVFVALIIAISILLLTFGCVYAIRSQTAYADYESDYVNNSQAIVNFNQLWDPSTLRSNYSNIAFSNNSGLITASGTNNNSWDNTSLPLSDTTISLLANHKYYMCYNFVGDYPSNRLLGLVIGSDVIFDISQDFEGIYLSPSNQSVKVRFGVYHQNSYNTKFYVYLVDLSLMFGINSEPTLSQCQDIFTADYYAYNIGTPIPFSGYEAYNLGVIDTLNSYNNFAVNLSAISSAFIDSSLNNSNAFVRKFYEPSNTDYSYYLQARGYLSIPFNTTIDNGSLISFKYFDPGQGGSGNYLWCGVYYQNSFYPVMFIGDLTGETITFASPVSTQYLMFADSSTRDYFTFSDSGYWLGDFVVDNAKFDMNALLDSARTNAYAEKDQYYQTYYGQNGTGYNSIYNSGYQTGINAQLSDAGRHFYTFPQFLGALFDVPVKTITSLLDFEVLGFNLKNFFFSLITLSIIFALIKFILVRTGDK